MMAYEENISIFLVFFVTLLALVLILSQFLHESKKLSPIIPEAAMVIAVGMVAGYLIHILLGKSLADAAANANNNNNNDDDAQTYKDDLAALLSFDPEFFFIFLLPPIIFNTGLRMGPLFFRHITPIIMFAIIGTAISAIVTALILYGFVKLGLTGGFEPSLAELLTFGALISSTDPVSTLAVFQVKRVDPRLFYLCFGESVLNDAVAIVLFYSFAKFVSINNEENDVGAALKKFFVDLFLNFVGSSLLGSFGGACAGFLFKQIDMRQNRLVEISVYVLLVYIPFLISEILHLSGIVTMLFTGVAANRYIVPNLSAITKVNSDMVFRLGAHLAETAIFLELGLSVFGMVGYWNWTFIGWSTLACLVGRALNVYPLAYIFNRLLLIRDRMSSPTSAWEGQGISFGTKKKIPTINTTIKADLSEGLATPTVRNLTPGGMMWGEGGRNGDPKIDTCNTYENDSGIYIIDQCIVENESFNGGDPQQHQRNGFFSHRTQSFTDQSVATEVTATPWEQKDLKIRENTAHMLWFCGLRGAVAYACVRTFPDDLGHRKDFTMTTMAIILITVFGLGLTTECALSWFKIDVNVDEKKYMQSYLREPIASNALLKFEERFIKRCVIRDFDIMESVRWDIQRSHTYDNHPTMLLRDPLPGTHRIEAIEMTESGHLGMVDEDDRNNDVAIQKLVRADSLFDYGGY
jgi:NhaP-type Na+/H+ or K+/H+ antiporter